MMMTIKLLKCCCSESFEKYRTRRREDDGMRARTMEEELEQLSLTIASLVQQLEQMKTAHHNVTGTSTFF